MKPRGDWPFPPRLHLAVSRFHADLHVGRVSVGSTSVRVQDVGLLRMDSCGLVTAWPQAGVSAPPSASRCTEAAARCPAEMGLRGLWGPWEPRIWCLGISPASPEPSGCKHRPGYGQAQRRRKRRSFIKDINSRDGGAERSRVSLCPRRPSTACTSAVLTPSESLCFRSSPKEGEKPRHSGLWPTGRARENLSFFCTVFYLGHPGLGTSHPPWSGAPLGSVHRSKH